MRLEAGVEVEVEVEVETEVETEAEIGALSVITSSFARPGLTVIW